MIAGRRTHDYPHGTPWPIRLSGIATAATGLLWIIFSSQSWVRGLPFVGLFVALGFLYASLIRRYEKSGRAVRLAQPGTTVVKFVDGTPRPIVALRYGYFVLAGLMILFGVAPFADRTARMGIIACVLGLFILAGVYIALEWRYVNAGRAKEIPRDSGR